MKALLISFVVSLLVAVAYGVIRVKSPCAPYHCSSWTVGDGVRRARWRVAPGEKDSRCKRGSNSRCQRTQRSAVAFERAIRDHDMRNAYFCRAE
jgi:hypothetical protein